MIKQSNVVLVHTVCIWSSYSIRLERIDTWKKNIHCLMCSWVIIMKIIGYIPHSSAKSRSRVHISHFKVKLKWLLLFYCHYFWDFCSHSSLRLPHHPAISWVFVSVIVFDVQFMCCGVLPLQLPLNLFLFF